MHGTLWELGSHEVFEDAQAFVLDQFVWDGRSSLHFDGQAFRGCALPDMSIRYGLRAFECPCPDECSGESFPASPDHCFDAEGELLGAEVFQGDIITDR
ncbi:hypothetical protein ACTTAI_14275 [Rhodobacter capsulatus]|uniref:hypothetical protein n=1 Tax=Rhodobacter capsulatus TaxID=1061 RepID=UPI004028C245